MIFGRYYLDKSYIMFSLIFFIFVAVILVTGYLAVTWKKKHRVPLENEEPAESYHRESQQRTGSAFNEPPIGEIKGGMVPTENKLGDRDIDAENEGIK